MGRENAKKMDDKLAGAALVLSILACASVFLLPLIVPFMLAGTALTLALISRGYGTRMPRKAEIAAGFCVVAIIGNIL
ncbi:MAG: hypothetical protein IJU50_09550, partial [Lachnospiraceae bacterium]|nr:hypothetical protein [Lachnospiraceae bacterium]